MREAITNFFTLQPQNLIPEVGILAVLIWMIVAVCAIFSVLSLKLGKIATGVWIAVIFALPLAGLFAYCLYCFTKVELSMLPAFAGWQQQFGGDRVGGAQLQLLRQDPAALPVDQHLLAADPPEYRVRSSVGASDNSATASNSQEDI